MSKNINLITEATAIAVGNVGEAFQIEKKGKLMIHATTSGRNANDAVLRIKHGINGDNYSYMKDQNGDVIELTIDADEVGVNITDAIEDSWVQLYCYSVGTLTAGNFTKVDALTE